MSKPKPITMDDFLDMTEEELEMFAAGARHLFGDANETDNRSENPGSDSDTKEGQKLPQ